MSAAVASNPAGEMARRINELDWSTPPLWPPRQVGARPQTQHRYDLGLRVPWRFSPLASRRRSAWNFAGYFTSINPAWANLLGYGEVEIKRMHVSEPGHPDDVPHANEGRRRFADGVPIVGMENRFRHKDGSWRWIYWTMTAE